MTGARLDVVGIGNALVDVVSFESDEFLDIHGLQPGAMTLIDTPRAELLYAAMGPAVESSGGSAANTLVGIASLGGSAAFIGRVADDQLGAVFGHDIRAAGVEFLAPPASGGKPSGRCLIMVTPDAQRTMNTYLGASAKLGPGTNGRFRSVVQGLAARSCVLRGQNVMPQPSKLLDSRQGEVLVRIQSGHSG